MRILYLLILFFVLSINAFAQSGFKYPREVSFGAATYDDKQIVRIINIENNTNLPIRFDRYAIINEVGLPSQVFRFDPPNQIPPVPFDFPPRSEFGFRVIADLEHAAIGRNYAYLKFFNDRIRDSIEIRLHFVLTKDSIVIHIPEVNTNLNSTVKIPILISGSKIPIDVTDIELTLSVNQTILTPSDSNKRGRIVDNQQIITENIQVNYDIRNKLSDTLTELEFVVMLGDAVYSDIVIEEVSWYRQGILLPRVPTITLNGRVNINDIFYDDGVPRLVTFDRNYLNVTNFCHDNNSINFKLSFTEKFPNISIFDINGNGINLTNNENIGEYNIGKFESLIINKSSFTNENNKKITEIECKIDLHSLNSESTNYNFLKKGMFFLVFDNYSKIISKKIVILN